MVVCGRDFLLESTVCPFQSWAHVRNGRSLTHLTSELLEALAQLLKALSEVGVQVCTTGDPAQISVSYLWTVLFSG